MSDPLNHMNGLRRWLATKIDIAEDRISPVSHLKNDLGLTAAKIKELSIEYGTRMAVSVSDSEAGTVNTIRDIYDIVDTKIRTQSAPQGGTS